MSFTELKSGCQQGCPPSGGSWENLSLASSSGCEGSLTPGSVTPASASFLLFPPPLLCVSNLPLPFSYMDIYE